MRLCNSLQWIVVVAGLIEIAGAQEAFGPWVQIPVTVTEANVQSRLVKTLGPADFHIYDNNVEQKVGSVATGDGPMSVGILFDLSASMRTRASKARDAVHNFIKAANPKDEFFLVGFSDQAEMMQPFTSSTADLEARLASAPSGKLTAFWDAMDLGIKAMERAKNPRKLLLVVGDGGDNRSHHTEKEIRARLGHSDVEVYAMCFFDPFSPMVGAHYAPQSLREMTEETGGRAIWIDNSSEYGDVAGMISTELRNQYVIGFRPSDLTHDGKWRKVKVKVNPPQGLPPLTVHARTGYYAPLQ